MEEPQGGVRKRAPGQSRSQIFPRFRRAVGGASPERLLDFGRIAVAVLLLAGAFASRDQPSSRLLLYLLGAYLAASLALACLPGRVKSASPFRVAILIVDAGILAAIVALRDGPAVPYLLPAALVVLTATIRWQWKGALVGAGALAAVLIGAGVANVVIDVMEQPVAAIANGDAEPPATTGSLGSSSGLAVGPHLSRVAEVLILGILFAILAAGAARLAAHNERARLARNVHDTVLQDLAAARFMLASISPAADGAKRVLAEVSDLLSEQQRRIRLMLGRSDDEPSSPIEPAVALQALAEELGRKWRCEVAIDFKDDPHELGADLVAELGLMLREAVANAVRHAKASRVHMAVARCDGRLRATFSDDGRSRTSGIMASPASLAARVASLGGSIATHSGVGGVTVTVELPL